jgi:glutathione S-transferase
LVDFIRVYHASDYLPADMVTGCVDRTDVRFRKLDDALDGKDWLVGDGLTLADIAWMPNAHRFELMDWPLDRYPNFSAWHDTVKELPSYQAGIVEWEPPPVREHLTGYVRTRGDAGHHVCNFGALAST